MVRSEKIGKIAQATEEIRISGDTAMIGALLYKADDPRLLYSWSYLGRSIYRIKMEALQEITGIAPAREITDDVATGIIHFYRKRFFPY